jgi:sugar diacid utilization regulator
MGQGEARDPLGMTLAEPSPVSAIIRRIESRVDELSRQMVARYCEEITDYRVRLAEDEVLFNDVAEVTADSVRMMLSNLEAGTSLTDEQFDRTRASAVLRVHQGIPLESFLRAVRIWGETFWQTVLETARTDRPEEREAALTMSTRVLRHIDLMSVAVAHAYVSEVQGVWSAREVVRRDLLDGLIGGKGDEPEMQRIARSFGVTLQDAYAVVLARGHDRALHATLDPPVAARGPLRRIVDAARVHLRPSAGCALVGMRQGVVVALYPLDELDEYATFREQCDGLARALEEERVSVGISGRADGLPAIEAMYSEASEALESATAAGIFGRAVVFDDVLIDHITRSSRHRGRILEATLEPLARYDAERQGDLVATLRAYVESGFNLTRSAETLCVHPNTVQYRLRRIKDLTGRNPFDPDDLLLLHLGLKVTELSPRA